MTKFLTFDETLDKVYEIWGQQKIKAIQADKLLEECEQMEEEMHRLLEEAEKMNPEGYKEFLSSFKPIEEKKEE